MAAPLPDDIALDVLAFWWHAGPARWFASDAAFDATCAGHLATHEQAAAGDLSVLEATPHGTLALLILLDQIPRNIFRGTPRAFATDAEALRLARQAEERRFPDAYPSPARNFFLLPFMHAEDLATQERSVDLFRATSDHDNLHYALLHHEAVARFGRFPHRNAVLGRTSTPAEIAWLEAGGFRG